MKKIYLFLLALFALTAHGVKGQILNQNASWGNPSWTLGGSYGSSGLINDPTTDPNFTFDDDAPGNGSVDNIFAESPVIDLTAAQSGGETWINIDFNYVYYKLSTGEFLNLEYWDADAGSWVLIDAISGNSTSSSDYLVCSSMDPFTSSVLDISGFTSNQLTNFQYRFIFDDDGGWEYGFCIDAPTIYSTTPPACLDPNSLTTSNLTPTSADLAWTDNNGGTTTWEVEYGVTGFTQGAGTTISPATNPQNVPGLSPNTTYDYYVRADCGSGSFSNWVGPFTFTTPCNALGVPFSEDFSSTSTTQNCWTVVDNNTDGDAWDMDYDSNPLAGDEVAAIYTDYNSGSNDDYLISPTITLTGNEQLRFSYRVQSDGEPNDFEVLLSTNGTNVADFTNTLLPLDSYDNESYIEQTIYLTSYTGDVNIAFHIPSGGLDGWRLYIDSVVVETAPSCPPPSQLSANNITGSSADISWTDNSGSGLFDIEVGPAGFSPTGTPTEAGITTNPYTLNSLSPTTSYDYYVRADCGGGDLSQWVGPYTFTTGQIPVSTFPYTQDWESGQGGWQFSNGSEVNQWNLGTAVNNGGSQSIYVSNTNGVTHTYNNSENSTVHAYRDISIPAGTPFIQLDFDWIADAESCCDEMRVFLAPTSFVPPAGSEISTSGTAPNGIIQLGGNYNVQTAFVSESFVLDQSYDGQTFRLIFQWHNDGSVGDNPPAAVDNIMIDVASCGNPLNLSSSNITNNTADIDWDAFGTEPSWNVQYGPAGFSLGSGTTWNVSAASDTTLDNLTQYTEYDVYVQAECGTNDTSDWVGPITFTTEPDCPEPIAFQIDGSTASSVDLSWVAQGTETSWNIVYGPAGFTPGSGAGTVENVTTNPATITGLQPGTVYDFYIEADCPLNNPYAGPVTYSTPIVNDAACDAIAVPVDGSTTQYTNEGATLETGELTTNGDNTVWFTFTAPADGHVEIRTCGNDFDNFIEVYEEPSDCGDFNTYTLVDAATDNPFATCSGTNDPAGLVLCGLNPGNTYYLAVGSESAGNTGIFPLTLTSIPDADAGTGTVTQVCSGDMVNLFGALSGNDNGGVWSEIDMTGGLEANGVYNTTNLAYIGYDVEYRVTNECSYDSTIVTVSINGPSSAGQDGTLTDCNVDTDFYLYDGLSGNLDFGGAWIDVDGTGKLNGSVFSPDSLTAGTYQFDYIVSNDVCPNDTSTVEVTITNCLSTEEFAAESFKIFPNPTNGIFYMVSTVNASNAIVEITDLQGKVISSEQMNINIGAQYDFNLSQLERGVYLIKVATQENTTVKRVVLQR